MDVNYNINDKETFSLVSLSEFNQKLNYKQIACEYIKKGVDIIAGVVGLILMIPITLGVYLANKLSKEEGPIFYKQMRIGKDGKEFEMYKYRTMVVGADEKLEQYLEENEEAKEEYSKYKKLKYDPRVTKIGNFLRKTSLDEFPQFINILKGEMTLVGPRPYLPREKEEMGMYYFYIIRSKPGLTGLWQISGRNNTTFEDRLKIDELYIHRCSLKADLKILIKTVNKVLSKKGAL